MSGVKMNASKAEELHEKIDWEMLSLEEAFTSMERMPQLHSVQNLTCLLHKCRTLKNPAYTKRLYACMRKRGLEDHKSLGNYLVPMLVQVGSMPDAQHVFDRLVDRNVYSWTSLILGYIECGELQYALNLYQTMQEDCVHPDKYTFVAVLKACARLKDAERGRELHAEIARKGLEREDPFVGSTLVDMYAKCGSLAKAQEVFDKLPVRNKVSWNALMSGYAEHGLGEEVLNCFEQMQLEGLSPDAVTFVCILKACGSVGATNKGREMHAEIARKGLGRNLFVGSTLVDMYAKCDSLTEAREVFDKIPVRNEVSWNSLMAGYAEHGLGVEALNCLEQMPQEGVPPDVVTYVCSLKACGSIGAITKGQEIQAEIVRKGLERHPFVGNILVDMHAKCGSIVEAREVFDKLPVRNEISWNALMTGYAEHGLGEEVLDCLKQMQLEGLFPNAVTFMCCLKACGCIGTIAKGQEVHVEIARKGLERDLFVGSTLVDVYVKCGSLAAAREAFDKMPVRKEESWNALMTGYAEHGLAEEALNCLKQMQLEGLSADALTFVCSLKACGSIGSIDQGREIHTEIAKKGLERDPFVGSTLVDMYAKSGSLAEAWEVFDKLPVRNEVSWNALMAGYVEQGLREEVLNSLEDMRLEGLSPNAVTFVCSLKACGSIGTIAMGREIHAEVARKELETCLFVGSALVDMYAQSAALAEAQEVFDNMPLRNEISWTALMGGYAQLGKCELVFRMLERMRGEGVKPDGVTLSIVLAVCSHTGLVDEGWKYFETMSKNYGITPNIEHHTGMVDLLGRAGQLNEAVLMVKKMPFHPKIGVWLTVLGACQKWGNVELGRLAFEHAVQLDEKDATAYVLMSNIYSHTIGREDRGNEYERTSMEEAGTDLD